MPASLDLLEPVVEKAQLHPLFVSLLSSRVHAPARDAIRGVFEEFPNPEPNFIRDFQTANFNSRLWELYVFGAGRCAGFQVRRPHVQPDFLFSDGLVSAWIEATTANPSAARPVKGAPHERDLAQELHHDVPISLGSALYSKLTKPRYWELPHVKGTPLVFAIADFHDNDVMRTTAAPLMEYLYGQRDASVFDANGKLVVKVTPVAEHRVGAKVVPSGFFGLKDAQHVTAVMFSNAGTLAKFNRIGFDLHPELYPDIWMLRWGVRMDYDPNEVVGRPFMYEVGDHRRREPEHWCEAVVMFHNPAAAIPLHAGFFSRYGQQWREGGRDRTVLHNFHPHWSITDVLVGPPGPELKERHKALRALWLRKMIDDAQAGVRRQMILRP